MHSIYLKSRWISVRWLFQASHCYPKYRPCISLKSAMQKKVPKRGFVKKSVSEKNWLKKCSDLKKMSLVFILRGLERRSKEGPWILGRNRWNVRSDRSLVWSNLCTWCLLGVSGMAYEFGLFQWQWYPIWEWHTHLRRSHQTQSQSSPRSTVWHYEDYNEPTWENLWI